MLGEGRAVVGARESWTKVTNTVLVGKGLVASPTLHQLRAALVGCPCSSLPGLDGHQSCVLGHSGMMEPGVAYGAVCGGVYCKGLPTMMFADWWLLNFTKNQAVLLQLRAIHLQQVV